MNVSLVSVREEGVEAGDAGGRGGRPLILALSSLPWHLGGRGMPGDEYVPVSEMSTGRMSRDENTPEEKGCCGMSTHLRLRLLWVNTHV